MVVPFLSYIAAGASGILLACAVVMSGTLLAVWLLVSGKACVDCGLMSESERAEQFGMCGADAGKAVWRVADIWRRQYFLGEKYC